MDVRVFRDEDAFDALAPEWDALHARSRTATVFNSVTYARVWWSHWGEPGALQLWTVREGGRLVGLAPLYEGRDEQGRPARMLVGGTDVSDYLDVLAAEGQEEAVAGALLAKWRAASCQCPILLQMVPHASPTREAFLRLAPELGFEAQSQMEHFCPVVTLPGSWEAYLQALDRHHRHELRRKMRKAGQEALVSWYRVGEAALEEEMAHFFRLHALSTPDKERFMTSEMRAFFLDLARAFAARGWLDLVFLLVNGERTAATMNFSTRDAVLVYNSGFDPVVQERLSPGWLLLCYQIEDAILEGKQRFDFMRGDEEYKYRFGARSEAVDLLRMEPGG